MDFTLETSLKSMTLVRVATLMWSHEDVRNSITDLFLNKQAHKHPAWKEVWYRIEEDVVQKISDLKLPQFLKQELTRFVVAIGRQILQWICFHGTVCKTIVKLPQKFCWTMQGSIDKRKTAEYIIENEEQSDLENYVVACVYCLENYIYSLHEKVEIRRMRLDMPPLVVFWTHYIQGEFSGLSHILRRCCMASNLSHYEYTFHFVATTGNDVATAYFLQKLQPEELERLLVATAVCVAEKRCSDGFMNNDWLNEYPTDTLCILLSAMSKEQQSEVFSRCPFQVLRCLLDWPWQNLFMELLHHMWPFLSEENYYYLFNFIAEYKIGTRSKDYDYHGLLHAFWTKSPLAYRKYVSDSCARITGLTFDFSADKEILTSILQGIINYVNI